MGAPWPALLYASARFFMGSRLSGQGGQRMLTVRRRLGSLSKNTEEGLSLKMSLRKLAGP